MGGADVSGTYLKVVAEGRVAAGTTSGVCRLAQSLTVGLVDHLNYTDRAIVLRLLAAAEGGRSRGTGPTAGACGVG
ncbi:MAG: hypothetical protein ACRDZ8_19845 [Acidimicrobiales bacterium]